MPNLLIILCKLCVNVILQTHQFSGDGVKELKRLQVLLFHFSELFNLCFFPQSCFKIILLLLSLHLHLLSLSVRWLIHSIEGIVSGRSSLIIIGIFRLHSASLDVHALLKQWYSLVESLALFLESLLVLLDLHYKFLILLLFHFILSWRVRTNFQIL